MKKIMLYALALFYIIAGINHFWHPQFYHPLIPDYLPCHQFINIAGGMAEIMLGAGVLFPATRKISCTGIIVLLIVFIPSHIYFIQMGGCAGEGLCVPVWIAWVRLMIIHPLLMYWAYSCRQVQNKNTSLQ
jgi:uncharacterized membrane protein